ncbi:Rha family transcriptional regulator, partial [Arsenophonus apicola]|uniref:Rha family transcriptional regulator n=1 Tax=Arsenophonus apicola TaxID=2879119 RepID=UPI00387944CB
MTTHSSLVIPKVSIHKGIAITTSQDVAEYFNKRHDNVLRAIGSLECSSEFRLLNFEETFYIRENPNGGDGISTKCYEMTKDGFVFLVMGFTGKKAAQFKEAYIAEFNRMEAQLHNAVTVTG